MHMHDKHTAEQDTELRALVDQVARHQGGMSDSAFCRRYEKFVGTSRTWKDRLVAGQFEQVDVPRKIEQLRSLLTYLEGGQIPEDFYEELPFNLGFKLGLARLEAQKGTDRRIFCVLGAVGVGKTMSCKASFRETVSKGYGGPRRILIIIPEALRENKVALLAAMAQSLNCTPEQSGAAALMDAIKGALSGTEITLIFDEAHQGGVMLMRIIKDLVNLTSARFVYVALRTEYMRVIGASRGNIVEAKQFVRRCLQPVYLDYAGGTKDTVTGRNGKVTPMDAALLLARKSGLPIGTAQRVASEKIGALRLHGNLSSLTDAVEKAERDADNEGNSLDAAAIAKAIDKVCPVAAEG